MSRRQAKDKLISSIETIIEIAGVLLLLIPLFRKKKGK
jgi:hypothetical protein